jgi:hypothetical protein
MLLHQLPETDNLENRLRETPFFIHELWYLCPKQSSNLMFHELLCRNNPWQISASCQSFFLFSFCCPVFSILVSLVDRLAHLHLNESDCSFCLLQILLSCFVFYRSISTELQIWYSFINTTKSRMNCK